MYTLIAIVALGVLCLIVEIFNGRKAIVPITIVGLLAILGLTATGFNDSADTFNNMIVFDNFATTFSCLFIVLTIFLVALSPNFHEKQITKISDFISIKLFLLSGGVAMVAFGNLSMFFLGIEILSIALYVLAASDRLSIKSNEAGMKYFLMGAFASGFILFGIALIYGATGSFDMATIQEAGSSADVEDWFYIGAILLSIGMLFKVAAAPFHFWAPDVYEGSPALTTALMSTLTKVIAMAAFFKLVGAMNVNLPYSSQTAIIVISILSMTIGNIMALKQTNVKRMLAFSGISHAGFMLMTLLAVTTSAGVLLYYASAYALSGIAAFAVILYVTKDKDNEDIFNFNGLGKTSPVLAGVLTCSLLSMAGIPIFSGFFAKVFLFGQMLNAGHIVLVIVAVVNSIISVGYYFKLILAMYTKEATEEARPVPFVFHAVAVSAIALNIAIGLYPSFLLDLLN
ncbi:NADH-quinone oxidoreductase subunit N [Flavobacterium macacae]|uniref:NADH-quinone oxidoreductase subunit N n=1 Tax=Flavobacterium macacae TaxID=2488993 RepID=A0A3P3WFN2_9FLAO|nr:NADH-quinone oxidoreductase subunit N [Flavobacterium macacae]RRJ93910.1 NADH-quinone oxidoreductase subunit N [Flavobacterium macacae]